MVVYQKQIKDTCESLKNDLQSERKKHKSAVRAEYTDDIRRIQYQQQKLKTSIKTWETRSDSHIIYVHKCGCLLQSHMFARKS